MQITRRKFLHTLIALTAFATANLEYNPAHARSIGDLKIVKPDGSFKVISETELLSLSLQTVRTRTAWTTGQHSFRGVFLSDILKAAGVDLSQSDGERVLRVSALNDYVVNIPLEDATTFNVLVAAYMDGDRLTVRDKGPYWLVYPRDDHPELEDSRYDHRWVWQLKELTIIAQ